MTCRPSYCLSVVASVLLVAATGCRPEDANPQATASNGSNGAQLPQVQQVVTAFKHFNADTSGWPMGNLVWDSKTNIQVEAVQFDTHDTALFQLPVNAKQCSDTQQKPCWNGPYLQGKSLADSNFEDPWGHSLYNTIIRPFDGQGGGTSAAPRGEVVVWSAGPDGLDGFGCSDGKCARNHALMAKGEPSKTKSDDVIAVVGTVN